MVKERILWIDFLKLLAIYLVVWGHVILCMGMEHDYVMRENSVYSFIYSFHMPLFMTISGFFSNSLLSGQGNIKRKFLQLIVPCISLGIFCLICDIHSLNFWYLKSLFICYLIWCVFFILFHRHIKIGILLFFVLGFFIFPLLTRIPFISSYKVDFMLPFLGLGLLISSYKELIDKRILLFALIAAVLFLFGEFFWNSSYLWYFSKPLWIDYKALLFDKQLIVDMTTFWQSLWRYVVGLFGSCFFLFACWSVNKSKLGGQLGKLGRYSLHVYILQSFIVELNIFHILFPTSNECVYSYIYAPLFSIAVVAVCILAAKILEKNKYVAFFLFGKLLSKK